MTSVVFMGTPEFAVPSLAALLRAGFDVAGVLTRADQPSGRGQRVEESPVKQFARANGLQVQQPTRLRGAGAEDALKALEALEPELIVVAAYGLILPPAVLDLPPRGCVNVHGSLLPRHRGAAPIAAAILAGDAETGISVMLMDEGVDTGAVLSTAALQISPEDTTGSLTEKLAVLGADLLTSTLPRWLQEKISPQPQNPGLATYAPQIQKDAGKVDWTEPARLIERKVRAYNPWPSTHTSWNGQRLKIIRARVAEGFANGGEPGVVTAQGTGAASVVTGEGMLQLLELQLAGRRPLPVDAFLRGTSGFAGSRLGK